MMTAYSWPGNVRELKSLVARAAVLANGPEITAEDLPCEFRVAQPPEPGPSHSLDDLEQTVIIDALEMANGRRNRAAKMLGISQRTLIRRLKSYGVNPTRPAACGGGTVN
jgi:DNA-binding NtrC family response regulator